MTLQLTVSPDFSPRSAPGWYVFNTWLQRALGEPVHLELYDSFEAQREAIAAERVDAIYANPYDASRLVRQSGFAAVAAPAGRSDEAVIVVPEASAVERVHDLPRGARVATTDDPDVHLMGMILLEPADLAASDLLFLDKDSYVLVAKELLQGGADAGFFLEAAFDELSQMVRSGLRPIARSRIQVVRHVLLVGPRLAGRRDDLAAALVAMHDDPRSAEVLATLGIPGWEPLHQEDVEFMVDLIDTLMARPGS